MRGGSSGQSQRETKRSEADEHTKMVIPSEYSTRIRRNLKKRAASRERPTTARVRGGFAFCAMLTEVHDDAGTVDQRRYYMLYASSPDEDGRDQP